MKYLILFLLSAQALAGTITGTAVGKSVAGGTYPNSVLTIKMQSGSPSPQGTFAFDPSASESYSGFPATMTVCWNSKGVLNGSGTIQGYHQVGPAKPALIKGSFSISVAPGSKGSFNLQFSDYTSGAVVFPSTTYNVISGGFGMVGEPCAL